MTLMSPRLVLTCYARLDDLLSLVESDVPSQQRSFASSLRREDPWFSHAFQTIAKEVQGFSTFDENFSEKQTPAGAPVPCTRAIGAHESIVCVGMLPTWVSTAAKGQGGPRKSLPLIVVVIFVVILWRQFSYLGSRISSLEHGHYRSEASIAHLSNTTALDIARLDKAIVNSTTVLEAQIQDVILQVRP